MEELLAEGESGGREVLVRGEEVGGEGEGALRLRNVGSWGVAWKVKLCDRRVYEARPSRGLLGPGEWTSVSVSRWSGWSRERWERTRSGLDKVLILHCRLPFVPDPADKPFFDSILHWWWGRATDRLLFTRLNIAHPLPLPSLPDQPTPPPSPVRDEDDSSISD